MRKVLLLVNSLIQQRGKRSVPRVLEVFKEAGVAVELEEAGEERAGGDKARRAVAEGMDAVIVCGGDGTVFDVLQGLAGTSVPLGIVPFGTGNVLAQNLKIPKDPAAAARWLLTSRPVAVPLGKITCGNGNERRSWFFAMSAGMGAHAALMEAAHGSQKQANGRAAYYVAGIRLLLKLPIQPFEVEITTTECSALRRQVCEALAVRVAELNLWRPGGGLDLPFLRLATVEGHSALRLTWAVAEALFGSAGERGRRQKENPPARYEDVLRVVCRPLPGYDYRMPIFVQADGEVLGTSEAEIEMAGVSVQLLEARS